MEKQIKTYKEILGAVKILKDSVKIKYLDKQCTGLAPDIFKICEDLDIKVYYGELGDGFEVAVWRDEETGTLKISIDENCIDKGRYLAAKALGAGLLGFADDGVIGFKKMDDRYNPASISSDIFATALLMDEDRVRDYLLEGQGSVERLSKLFEVPLSCAAKRLVYLDKTRWL